MSKTNEAKIVRAPRQVWTKPVLATVSVKAVTQATVGPGGDAGGLVS